LVKANIERGETTAFLQGYKRYRVSSQRFSEKPMNVEFVLLTDTSRVATRSVDDYVNEILQAEQTVISSHAETIDENMQQGVLF
jgi:adenine-specific DNA-methyltransferase